MTKKIPKRFLKKVLEKRYDPNDIWYSKMTGFICFPPIKNKILKKWKKTLIVPKSLFLEATKILNKDKKYVKKTNKHTNLKKSNRQGS